MLLPTGWDGVVARVGVTVGAVILWVEVVYWVWCGSVWEDGERSCLDRLGRRWELGVGVGRRLV